MKKTMNFGKKGMLCATALTGFFMMPMAVNAGDVTLKSSDGTVNITGEFVEFKEDNYIVRTALGELRIAASRVRCEGADCPSFDTAESDIHFIGSNTVGLGIMPLLLGGYAAHLDAEINIANTQTEDEILADMIGDNGFGEDVGTFLVTSSTSGRGFEEFVTGDGVVGMSSRRIEPAEAREIRNAGKGNMVSTSQEHIIAVDSLIIIVNQENGIDSISVTDLQGIYSGAITNWKQLGGEDLPIQAITHKDDSGTLAVFQKHVYGKEAPVTPEGIVVGESNNEIAAFVNDQMGAIGFVGHAFKRGAKPLSLVSECGIVSSPDPFSVKTEEYTLNRRLYLYNAQDAGQDIQDFVGYALSESADGVIAKAGFIDLGISKREQTMDSHRATALLNANVDAFEGNVIREMLAEMVKSERLSSTFRFRTGSSKLDERGYLEMKRLASYLEDMPDGTNVTMVGFTDSVGAFEPNRSLSIQRAKQVIAYLQESAGDQIAHVNFTATGFGEISPSGCNNSVKGRDTNRRVEVWVSK